jgi:hypothetical protein
MLAEEDCVKQTVLAALSLQLNHTQVQNPGNYIGLPARAGSGSQRKRRAFNRLLSIIMSHLIDVRLHNFLGFSGMSEVIHELEHLYI